MKYRFFVLLASLLLPSIGMSETYLGQQVIEVAFKVDGDKTINLPMTRAGAIPIENDNYKIEGAGFNVSLNKATPEESKLNWAFSFLSKKSTKLEFVSVEQVGSEGELDALVKDEAPVLKNANWVGHAPPKTVAKNSSPWLYTSEDTTLIFKFTIKTEGNDPIIMYQPSTFPSKTKAMYLKVIGIKG